MKKWIVMIAVAALGWAQPIAVPREEAVRAGKQVWLNECGGRVDGLTHWNAGEHFPSLGIGHFIWYPEGKTGPFDESFPELVSFLMSKKVKVPAWVVQAKGAPWQTQREFFADTGRLRELRDLLKNSVPEQTEFMALRMQQALPRILAVAKNPKVVEARFRRVFAAPGGVYALLDYVNFKGEGVKETERYKGQGWGLLQVLEGMSDSGSPVRAFAQSADRMLTRRVANAPPARGEERWLAGWRNRLSTYR
jgi:hypothetical protein